MKIACKQYFKTIIKDIVEKHFLFSIQNYPYPAALNAKNDSSGVESQTSLDSALKLKKSQNILILIHEGWVIEECCVQESKTISPGGALLLAAYLRKLGHKAHVLTYCVGKNFFWNNDIDTFIIYSPWFSFINTTAPLFSLIKKLCPQCITILIMYESLADFELQAMKECPEIDYAILPNEKEISVSIILDHAEVICPGGFGEKKGIIYRDKSGQPISSGKHPFAKKLTHLPYAGNEIKEFLKNNNCNSGMKYKTIPIIFQRGCASGCIFCPLQGTRPRYRDPDAVIQECLDVTEILGPSSPWLLTHEVFRKPEELIIFSDLILKQNAEFQWSVGARCEFVNDLEVLKQLKSSGLKQLYFGIESATEENRFRLRKPITDTDIATAIKLSEKAKIEYTFSFIVGFPWEDEKYMEIMKKYFHVIGESDYCLRINLAQLIPYPGLPIEKEFISEGIIDRPITFQDFNLRIQESIIKFRKTKYLNGVMLENKYTSLLNELINMGLA